MNYNWEFHIDWKREQLVENDQNMRRNQCELDVGIVRCFQLFGNIISESLYSKKNCIFLQRFPFVKNDGNKLSPIEFWPWNKSRLWT